MTNELGLSKWILRTVYDNLYWEDDEHLFVQMGESVEVLNLEEYKELQEDLILLGVLKRD